MSQIQSRKQLDFKGVEHWIYSQMQNETYFNHSVCAYTHYPLKYFKPKYLLFRQSHSHSNGSFQ